MKSILFIYLGIILFLTSCQNKNEIIINDVTKSISSSLKVNDNKIYSSYTIKVIGEVNDTILINEKIKLCCKVDTILKYDYYGGDRKITLIYKPYKASKGYLKINHYLN